MTGAYACASEAKDVTLLRSMREFLAWHDVEAVGEQVTQPTSLVDTGYNRSLFFFIVFFGLKVGVQDLTDELHGRIERKTDNVVV